MGGGNKIRRERVTEVIKIKGETERRRVGVGKSAEAVLATVGQTC